MEGATPEVSQACSRIRLFVTREGAAPLYLQIAPDAHEQDRKKAGTMNPVDTTDSSNLKSMRLTYATPILCIWTSYRTEHKRLFPLQAA